jgi:hypothetical protein
VVIGIIIGVLSFLLLWLLFSPLVLQVDTRRNEYTFYWLGLANVKLVPLNDDLLLRLRLPFWRKDFSILQLLTKSNQNKQNRTREVPSNQKQKSKWRFSWTRIHKVFRSFRVQYFRMEMDTDDYVMNAYLYPVCNLLNAPNHYVTINFQGRNQCAFRVQNRIVNILIAFIF